MALRERYLYRDGKWRKVNEKPKPRFHFVQGDLPMYFSPVTNQPVEGRYQRREDLKRNGCREVDPSEIKYINQPRDEQQKRLDNFVDNKIDKYLREKWN